MPEGRTGPAIATVVMPLTAIRPYIPAVGAVGLTAVLAAPLGAWLAHIVPVVALRQTLAVLFICVALNLGFNALPDGRLFQSEAKQMWAGMFPATPALIESSEALLWLQTRQ